MMESEYQITKYLYNFYFLSMCLLICEMNLKISMPDLFFQNVI